MCTKDISLPNQWRWTFCNGFGKVTVVRIFQRPDGSLREEVYQRLEVWLKEKDGMEILLKRMAKYDPPPKAGETKEEKEARVEMERLREARARVLAKWWVDTESALLKIKLPQWTWDPEKYNLMPTPMKPVETQDPYDRVYKWIESQGGFVDPTRSSPSSSRTPWLTASNDSSPSCPNSDCDSEGFPF